MTTHPTELSARSIPTALHAALRAIARATALPLLLAPLVAQSLVVPAAYANARGGGGANTLTRNAGQPRTMMLGIAASEFAGLPPSAVITGVSFRASIQSNTFASWPPSDADWTAYDVTIGNAMPLATWTTALAGNFSGTPVIARSGPLRIVANTFPHVSSLPAPQPNEWGEFYWDFQTSFQWTGTDVALLFRHTGSNLAGSFAFLDWQTAVTTVIAYTATSYQATTGTRILSPPIARFHYGYGTGCRGAVGSPMLVQNANTANGQGGTILMSIGNGPPNVPALYAFGFGRGQVPLGNGCNLLMASAAATLFVPLDANGRARIALAVPPGITGSFLAQAFVLDLGAPGGFSNTNGIEPRAQ